MNRRRPSQHLLVREVEALCNAVALAQGKPRNTYIVIHLKKVGIGISEGKRATQIMLNHLRNWLEYHPRKELAYITVFENPTDGGFHVNIITDTPCHLRKDLSANIKRWIDLAGGDSSKADVVRSKPIRGYGDYVRAWERYDANGSAEHRNLMYEERKRFIAKGLVGLMRYVGKGLEANACGRYGIKHVGQGHLPHRRFRISHTLNTKRQGLTSTPYPRYPSISMASPALRRRQLLNLFLIRGLTEGQ
jgi:hypothetical protein